MRHRHSGQTLGMHEGMNSGLPCANFPRKTSIEKDKKQTLARKIRKRNLKFWYKSAKGNKNRKKNSRIFEHKAYLTTGILLIYHSLLRFIKLVLTA